MAMIIQCSFSNTTLKRLKGTMLTSRLLRHGARSLNLRFLSADPLKDPARFIEGLTPEEVEKNEEIAAFIKANFQPEPETSSMEAEVTVDDFVIENNAASALNIRKLQCYLRDPVDEEGSRRCDTVRDNGEVPGIIYGGDPTQGIRSTDGNSRIYVKSAWPMLQRELALYHRSFESRVYDLTVYEDESDQEGTVHRVVPTSVNRHPIQHKLFCTNYLRYHPGRPIKIPIVYVNEEESPALKRGGFIAPISRYVTCLVEDGAAIPECLELECTGLQTREVLRLDRITFPDGVRICKRVKQDRFIIGSVFGRRGDAEDEDAETEAADDDSK